MLWIDINVTIFSTEQAILYLNFGTSNCLCRFGDNRSLEQFWLLSFVFKCLSVCVIDVYVKRQFLLLTKENIKNIFIVCLPPVWNIIFSLKYFAPQHLFDSYLNLKYPLKIHSHRSDILKNRLILVNIEEWTWKIYKWLIMHEVY